MFRILRKLQRTIIALVKLGMYLWIGLSYFLIMGQRSWSLLRLSRTMGVTLLTFTAVLIAMTAAYGGCDIGRRKSKPIISSIALATGMTDIVTTLQLSIMNTNAANGLVFSLENFFLLIPVLIAQLAGIWCFVYLGNGVYFRINKPERCCVVTSSKSSFLEIAGAAGAFKKQYDIRYVRRYDSEDLQEILLKCDTVFLYDVPVKERTELVEFCYRNMLNIYFNPEIADIVEMNARHVILDDVSLISAPVKELSFEQQIMKRTMDIVLCLIALIPAAPIMLICAIAIKKNDGGPVFFKQERATKGGKVFSVYKFRTMKENAAIYSATSDDDRITSVGRVLRKYRLDEIPQILNILKGEMSIVGPRPEMLSNVYMYTKEYPEFAYRLRVKAGLTGYAQIAGKYNTTPKYKLILDLMYIENYSIMKDIKLMLQTLIVLFKPDSTEGFATALEDDMEKYSRRMDIRL